MGKKNLIYYNMLDRINIQYNGKKYDATDYIESHPGGAIIKQYNGKDITEIFHKIGHSTHALNVLTGLPGLPTSRPTEPVQYSKSTVLTKLNTHEDPYNLHKIAGVISLFSFILTVGASSMRLVLKNCTTTVFHKPTTFTVTLLIANIFLVISSLQFKVSKKKQIYSSQYGHFETSEKRLHSIIFSLRSLCAIVIVWLARNRKWNNRKWKLMVLIYVTHLAADCVTAYYEGNDGSTIQSNHSRDVYNNLGVNFASFSQLGAILMIGGFGRSRYWCDNMFMILMSIQLSVFFDTLKKKNLLDETTSGRLYFLSLLITLVQVQFTNSQYLLWLVFGVLRMYFKINKYILYVLILPLGSIKCVADGCWTKYGILMLALLFCLFLGQQAQQKRYIQCFLVKDYNWETITATNIVQVAANTLKVRWDLGPEYVNKLSLGKHLYFRFNILPRLLTKSLLKKSCKVNIILFQKTIQNMFPSCEI